MSDSLGRMPSFDADQRKFLAAYCNRMISVSHLHLEDSSLDEAKTAQIRGEIRAYRKMRKLFEEREERVDTSAVKYT